MRTFPLVLTFIGLLSIGCGSDDGGAENTPNPGGGDAGADGPDTPGSDGGDDSGADSGTPGTTKWATVSLGGTHACALTVEGKAYCWGNRTQGACGDGEPGNTEFDWRKLHPVAGGLSFTKIAAGNGHTCAIDTSQKLHCWGSNGEGMVGDGGPVITNEDYEAGLRFSPVAIRSESSFVDVHTSSEHTCAIDTAGKLYCWGRNNSLQAGGPSASQPVLTPTQLPGTDALAFESVAAGGSNGCAVTADGAAYCWGDRVLGNLGDGAELHIGGPTATPVAVTGGIQWAQIAAENHTCGIEKGTGDVYCWGENSQAQHGIAPEAPVERISSPRKMTSDFEASAIAVLNGNTCALDASGAAFCWGMHASSGVIANGEQYGPETVTNEATPQPVTGGHVFKNLAARASMVCGTTTGGDIYCWGDATSTRFLDAESSVRNATPRKLPDPE